MVAAASNSIPFSIEPREAKKIGAVTLCSFALFGLNSTGAVAALALGGVTLISERTVREEKTDWFDTKSIEFIPLAKAFIWTSLQRIVLAVACVAILVFGGFAVPASNPQVAIEAMRIANPLQFIFTAVVVAPITEEILFRGFLQERLEDLSQFVLFPFSKETREKVCNVAQAVLFGYVHIIGGQVSEAGKWIVMTLTTHVGYVLGKLKLEKKSLLAPMGMHATYNGASLAFFLCH
jgi:membrane protease YdiL (CAAX protease family)